uniref:Beclin 1-associated autophagy-related key regulator n=1 Tax=Gouania willdenowi TaxID=441366 RepID=A0A8C5NEN5_GOUWI
MAAAPGPAHSDGVSVVTDALSVAVERCPLCCSSRRRLTCSRCIKDGDFVHLNTGRPKERYSEKLEHLKKLQEQKEQLQYRMKVEQLKEALASAKQEVKSDKEVLKHWQDETERLQKRAERHRDKGERIQRHNRKLREIEERRRRELLGRLGTLGAVRREHLQQLTTYILPLQEDRAATDSRDEAALASSTVSELAEARRTTYLSGRWVWDDQNGETTISIGGPPVSLPANGDCSAYYSWVEEKSTNHGPELDHINPAHTVSAALCYATQLTNILSHILDVNLPKKLCNSEFCGDNLSRYRFTRALNKLNTNILHLCFSQHVDPEKLHPHHTLRNIMFLISEDNPNLGRSGPFEVLADLEESMELVELVDPEGVGPAEDSEDEISDEETDLGTDWETVPSPRFCDIPSQSMDLSQSALQVSQPSAPSGGMISSAAASVTSWFKTYTSQR